jgi:hypothetical protein
MTADETEAGGNASVAIGSGLLPSPLPVREAGSVNSKKGIIRSVVTLPPHRLLVEFRQRGLTKKS